MDKESIFVEALKQDSPDDRARFLDEACGANADLRAEIEALLAAHDDAGSFLNRPPAELDVTTDPDDSLKRDEAGDAWREQLEPNDNPKCLGTLGPYEVLELVGRGGMGVVLRAHDSKLNRTVAIKLLAPELSASVVAVRRFLREAQAAAAVSHDHVVTIHAIDEQARPPIIVMEYIDGQSLQQKIDSAGALDVKSVLRIGMQTAAGLAAAHRQGLVHRDVKPSNILLENGIERVKLTDFGLARAVDDIGMTRTGQITGTPQYMSPEQAQGKSIDHRTDLFSLGCVLYAMCTGRAAFRADSAVAVMHRVVHDAPRPIRELNEDIPDWLCEIVHKLLEKNPEDRFASAEKVEDLLGRHLAHLQQPESAPQPERVASSSAHLSAAINENTNKGLRFVFRVLSTIGSLSLLWFVANLFLPYHGFAQFGFTMPTLLLSLLTGGLALNGAWHAAHRRSYGWTVTGVLALVAPVNLPQMLSLFFSAWASAILWRQEVKNAFASSSVSRRSPVVAGRFSTWSIWMYAFLAGMIMFLLMELIGQTHFAQQLSDGLKRQARIVLELPELTASQVKIDFNGSLLIRDADTKELIIRPGSYDWIVRAGDETLDQIYWEIRAGARSVQQLDPRTTHVELVGPLRNFVIEHLELHLSNPDTIVNAFVGNQDQVENRVLIYTDPGPYEIVCIGESRAVQRADVVRGKRTPVAIPYEVRMVEVRRHTDADTDEGKITAARQSAVADESTLNLPIVPTTDGNAAWSIIDKAIQFHGGTENVARWKSARAKTNGTVSLPNGESTTMTVEDIWSYPARFRTTREIDRGGITVLEVMVLNGDTGWLRVEGATQPMPALAEMQEQLYCQSFDKLFPLLEQRSVFQVASLPEALVEGAAAVGVVVSANRHRDVKLYFDKSTGLLIKREHRIVNNSGTEVIQEVVFSDYENFDGLMHWTKFSAFEDGRKTVAGELVSFTIEDKLDASIFDRP